MSHAGDFGRESGREQTAAQLVMDYRQADLSERERLLCDFAVLLTLKPADVRPAHLDRLRQGGISDDQITIATQVIGYFNYINRVADGLGVEPEAWMDQPTPQRWETERGTGYLQTLTF